MKLRDILNEGKKETKVTKINEGQHRKLERDLKNLPKIVKIDFEEALENLEQNGVPEAIDLLEIAIERIEDIVKDLKRIR